MRALTSFGIMKKNLKPSRLREYLRRTGLLGVGLFVGVLAITATDVSAQETIETPAAEGASIPAAEGASIPAAEGASTPAAEGASTPAAEGASTPAAEGASTPAAEGASTPAAEGASAPAAEGASTPTAEGASAPAAEGASASSDAEAGAQESPASASTDTQVTQSAAEPVLEEAAPASSAPQRLLDELLQILDTPEESGAAGPDLSPMGMYRGADIVVKLVMLGLIFASVVTWAIWLSKTIEIAGAVSRARRVLRSVNDSRSMAEAAKRVGQAGGPAAEMLRAVQAESAFSEPLAGHVNGVGLKERVSSVLDQISATAGRRAAVGTGLLATIGSTAPFVGLFGTVWGIMNSFIGIAEAQSSSLAVVAPGIAEALLATALGLVAAIPAVIIYNACARWITGYRHTLSEVAAGIERLVSRDLDFRHIPAKPDLDAQAAE